MEGRVDRRAQSVQVGAILLLGVVLLAVAMYQFEGVPGEVRSIEYEHDRAAEGELLELRNAVGRAGTTGGSHPVGIDLGVTYSNRPVFVMPPPASGELTTTEPRELRIENALALEDDVDDFWTGEPRSFYTSSIRHSVDYNEYLGAPDRYVEHGILVAAHDEAVLFRSDGAVVDGDRIDLTVVTGRLGVSGSSTQTVDSRAVSTATREVSITGAAGEDLVLVLPTAVDGNPEDLERAWREAVGDDANVTVEDGEVRLVLDGSGTYRLRLSKVTVGAASADPEAPAYVSIVSSSGQGATAEVRDRFNNPVPAAPVDVYHGTTLVESTRADAEGRVQTAPVEGGTVHFAIDGADPAAGSRSPLVASVDFLETAPGPSSTFEVTWDLESMASQDGVEIAGQNSLEIDDAIVDTLEGVVTVTSGGDPVDGATVEVSSADRSVAAPDGQPVLTDENGQAVVDVAVSGGVTRLFSAAGDGVDVLTVEVSERERDGVLEAVRATDLVANDVQEQSIQVDLGEPLADGDVIAIDLEATGDEISYPPGTANYDVRFESGDVTRTLSGGQVTHLEYESAGDDAGETIEIVVDGVDVGDVAGNEYVLTFESGAEVRQATFAVDEG